MIPGIFVLYQGQASLQFLIEGWGLVGSETIRISVTGGIGTGTWYPVPTGGVVTLVVPVLFFTSAKRERPTERDVVIF
jgi:hypothetical protein